MSKQKHTVSPAAITTLPGMDRPPRHRAQKQAKDSSYAPWTIDFSAAGPGIECEPSRLVPSSKAGVLLFPEKGLHVLHGGRPVKALLTLEATTAFYNSTDTNQNQTAREYGVQTATIGASGIYWSRWIPGWYEKLQQWKRVRKAFRKLGNSYGRREHCSGLVDAEILLAARKAGEVPEATAKRLGTTPYQVIQSYKHHQIPAIRKTDISPRLRHMGSAPFERLDPFAPGLLEAVKPENYAQDPKRFFHLLYRAHLALLQMQETIKEAGGTLDYHAYNKDFDRKYITFSMNRYEGLLAAELLALGDTEHRRLWTPPGELLEGGGFNLQFDFVWERVRLAVEVDGSSHDKMHGLRHQARSEERKQAWATTHGWHIHRVSWKDVAKSPTEVAQTIQCLVSSMS